MRKERDQQCYLRHREGEIRADRVPVPALGEPEPSRHHPDKSRQKGGNREGRDYEPAPDRGSAKGSVHPTSNARNAAGADSVRRRLSIIFQRPIKGIAVRR